MTGMFVGAFFLLVISIFLSSLCVILNCTYDVLHHTAGAAQLRMTAPHDWDGICTD